MKRRTVFALAMVLVMLTIAVSCVKELEELGFSSTTEYTGTIVEKSTLQPIKGVKVQVTDGDHVHVSTETNEQGVFTLKDINFNELDEDCFLFIDGSALGLPSTKEELRGFGYKTYDYKMLALYDKTSAEFLPVVTTVVPIISGTYAVSGGNITSDGGFPVTARGICYSKIPNPDLSSTHNHTLDGSGMGQFSSQFSLPQGSGAYYVRAYATNANGTTYGKQEIVVHLYDTLPTFNFNGHTYKVAPPLNGYFSFIDAYNYCYNLTFEGYSDWEMPTREELLQMYALRASIGGFSLEYYWCYIADDDYIYGYLVDFYDGSVYRGYDVYYHRVRPIRVVQ